MAANARRQNDGGLRLGGVWRAVAPLGRTQVRRDDVWMVQTISAAALAGPWGLWLLMPVNTFGTITSYRALSAVAPDAVWGLVFTVIAAALYWGQRREDVAWQGRAAVASFLAFTLIGAAFAWSNPLGTGWGVYWVLAAANWWVMRRLKQGSL